MLFRFCVWLEHARWIVAVNEALVPSVLIELAHYFGFFLLVGSIVILDLRILGVAGKAEQIGPLAKSFVPVMCIGLALSVFSGFVMFAGQATMFFPNPVFRVKLLAILLALAVALLVQRKVLHWSSQSPVSAATRCMAFASLVLWIGTILAAVEIPHLTYVP